MNEKTKQMLQLVFIAAVVCWVLISTARAENWGLFGLDVGIVSLALLIGAVAPGKTRRLILNNMTREEKSCLSRIGQQTGKRLGIRIAPFAFLIPFLGMLFGVSSLVFILPPAIVLFVILCLPVWRKAREQANATLLSTAFAQANGITTLKRNNQPERGGPDAQPPQ